MKVIPYIIESFAKKLINILTKDDKGGVYFEGMKRAVAIAEDSNLRGGQKFNLAVQEFKRIGYQLAGLALNVGMELAVVWLNMYLGKIK